MAIGISPPHGTYWAHGKRGHLILDAYQSGVTYVQNSLACVPRKRAVRFSLSLFPFFAVIL
jgi:hypothetical protein